jgi:hypothetical protein
MMAWLCVVLGLGIALRAPALFRPLWSDDEAIYAVTADALQRGALLYRDVVDHKPPLVYQLYRAGFAALGPYDMRGPHLLVIGAVALTAALLFAIARVEEAPEAIRSGLAAAGLFLVFSTTWHDYDALAANCELFLLAPQSLAAWLLVRSLGRTPRLARSALSLTLSRRRERGPESSTPSPSLLREGRGEGRAYESRRAPRGSAITTHVVIGVLVGISALFKYQGITFLGASIGLLLWWVALGRMSRSRAGLAAACQLAGAVLPPVLYLLACRRAGNLDAALFWFRFNFSYVQAGLGGAAALARGLRRTALIGGAALVPYALGLSAAVATASRAWPVIRERWRGSPARDDQAPPLSAMLGLLWLATSAIAVAAGGRFFGHYFHLILAPLCLLAAPAFGALWARRGRYRTALLVLCALPALFFFGLATAGRSVAAAWDEREPPYQQVAARIAARTGPDDRIFVWGNSPQLYYLARRPMGARFTFCNYVTGESPGTPTETGAWNSDANQLPAAWDMLLDDLDRRRPRLFVDAAAAGWDGYGKYPLARYPRLRDYVARNYRAVEAPAGVVLYERTR